METSFQIAIAHVEAAYRAMAPHTKDGRWIGTLDPLVAALSELGVDPRRLQRPMEDARVWWIIDLPFHGTATSMALEAHMIQRDAKATAGVFEVETDAGVERVDLDPREEEPSRKRKSRRVDVREEIRLIVASFNEAAADNQAEANASHDTKSAAWLKGGAEALSYAAKEIQRADERNPILTDLRDRLRRIAQDLSATAKKDEATATKASRQDEVTRAEFLLGGADALRHAANEIRRALRGQSKLDALTAAARRGPAKINDKQ